MTELERLCRRDRVRIDARYGEAQTEGWDGAAHNWRVTIKRKGRQLTVDFFAGSACGEPTAADVLYCLCSDVSIHENDEYGDLGMDASQAIATYKAMEVQTPKTRAFLADAFDEYASAEH